MELVKRFGDNKKPSPLDYSLPVYLTRPQRVWGFTAMYTNFILSIVIPEHHKFMVIHDQASYGIKLKADKNCKLLRLTAWQVLALSLALSFDFSIGRSIWCLRW